MAEKFHVTRVFRSIYMIPVAGLLVLAAVWIGILVRLSVEKDEVLQAAQTKANMLAEALVQHIETTIHDIDVIALVVKREFELNPASVDLRALQEDGFFSWATAAQVSVVNAAGCILQSTIPYAGGIYITDREHFSVHRKSDVHGLYISKPVLGRVSGIWTIQLTRRLNAKNGDFAGVVVISENLRYFTREFSNVADLGEGGAASVFQEDGTRLSDDQHRAEMAGARGDASYPKYTSGEQIFARRPVPGYPLVVEISLSRTEAMVPHTRMKVVYLASAIALSIFFIIFLAAISVLVHRLSRSRNRLRILSETDALTGLWNRYGILARLAEMLPAQTGLRRLAVIYIDLGNLKQVNDTLGHEAGDQLLKKVAIRLRDELAPATLGRFGGDEFIAILNAEDDGDDVYPITNMVLRKIVDVFKTPVALKGSVFNVRASIGVSVHAQTGDGVSTLIREADEAMYSAKSQMRITQKTVWRFYSDDMREDARRMLEAEQELRSALSKGTLKLALYPVRHRANERTWGFRVRAVIPDGMNSLASVPDAVAFTRENGLVGLVTESVLLQMCVTSAGWQDSKISLQLAYQLGRDQFLTTDCASVLRSLIMEFKVAPATLVLEIPESAFLEEPLLAEQRATALSSVGVGLMLREFSAGFASFALLEKGGFSGVVIEQSPSSADILTSVVERVTKMDLTVILESHALADGLECNPLVYEVKTMNLPLDGNAMKLPSPLDGSP